MQYLVLAEVHGIGGYLFALIAATAAADTLYWTSYHAYFASLGDAVHRGQQIGAREAIVAIVGIAAPLVAGWALVVFGPRVAFGATGLVIVLAAAPLLWTPNIVVPRTAPRAFRAALPGVLLFVADGSMAAGLVFVWRLALFISLGEQFQAFGGAMAIAALVGAAGGLMLGRFIDAGHGGRAVFIALGVVVSATLLRAVSYGDPTVAIVANAFGALMASLYVPTVMTSVYNQAKLSPCVTRFHIATEGGWDIGGGAALLLCAGLLHVGIPIGVTVATALVGAVGSIRAPAPLLPGRRAAEPRCSWRVGIDRQSRSGAVDLAAARKRNLPASCGALRLAAEFSGERGHAHHHLRHQELRHHEEGARLARQARRRLRLPRLQDRRHRARQARRLGEESRLGDAAQPRRHAPSRSCPTRTRKASPKRRPSR